VAGGDIPTPAKRILREIANDPGLFDKMDEYLMPTIPYLGSGKVSAAIERFIKIADAIEGYHFIHDNHAGTHAQVVVANNRRRMEDLVHKYDTEEPQMGWYPAVNEVLTAMGLPYAHRESRISPP
jgi:hypothetical protein